MTPCYASTLTLKLRRVKMMTLLRLPSYAKALAGKKASAGKNDKKNVHTN